MAREKIQFVERKKEAAIAFWIYLYVCSRRLIALALIVDYGIKSQY